MRNWISPFLVIVMLGYFISKQVVKQKSNGLKEAVDFSAELISGENFTLSSLEGNYVLLDFWGSWCGPCRADIPKLLAIQTKYKNESFNGDAKLILVTVALEKLPNNWKAVAERYNFDWKHQIVQQNKLVMLSPIARKFGVTDIPAKFLIGPEGDILAENNFEEMDDILSQRLN